MSPLVMGGLAQTLASSGTESGAKPVRLAARIGSFPVVRQESGFPTGAGHGPRSPSMACRLNLPGSTRGLPIRPKPRDEAGWC
jgi:hypothetical protein